MFESKDSKSNRALISVTLVDETTVTVSVRLPLSSKLNDAVNNADTFLDVIDQNGRQAFLAKGRNLGLTDSEVKQLQAETKDDYIERNLKRHNAKHQHNSIIALAAIRSDSAYAALAEARKTGNAKLQTIIDAAVKHAKSFAVDPTPTEGKSPKKSQEGPIKQKEMMR